MRMKDSGIAKPNYPFWLCFEFFPVQFINDPYYAIAASCAHDGFYFRVVQHLLKIPGSFFISTAEGEISFIDRVPDLYFIAPAFHFLYSRLNFLVNNITRGGRDAYNIPRF